MTKKVYVAFLLFCYVYPAHKSYMFSRKKNIEFMCGIFSLAVAAGAICSCVSTPRPVPVYQPQDDKYTSAHPSREVSAKLSRIQNSVQRIISTVGYSVYYFNDKRIAKTEVSDESLSSFSTRSVTVNQSNAGTAISVLQNEDYTLLLTAYHIIASPDTVVTFVKNGNVPDRTFIKSMSIKKSDEIFLFNSGSLIKLEMIAADPFKDLALLIAPNVNYDYDAPPLQLQTGTAKNLQLGTFIFVLGFPLGNPMVTSGIVSAPDYDMRGGFLTDALFNHGISGGLIIASNDGYDSFEWVGMSSTASVNEQFFLVPDPIEQQFYSDFDVYADSVYIDQKSFINYGVSRAISIERILEFLYENEDLLNRLGFSATDLVGQ